MQTEIKEEGKSEKGTKRVGVVVFVLLWIFWESFDGLRNVVKPKLSVGCVSVLCQKQNQRKCENHRLRIQMLFFLLS